MAESQWARARRREGGRIMLRVGACDGRADLLTDGCYEAL